ncbi:complexin-3 [Amia ocellicauda]|uniref:complexin-3 n=1 Tax=Amia ocellicauda TaxID=2972642 RepID=UPI0034639915
MGSMVKAALGGPLRQLSCCVSVEGGEEHCRSAPPRMTPCRTTKELRSYQKELEQERQRREGLCAQKNAQRAAMRSHFRQKYQLAKNSKDASHVKAVGGKVVLPHELAAVVRPKVAPPEDGGFSFFGSFQGLSLDGLHSGTQTPNKQCAVM